MGFQIRKRGNTWHMDISVPGLPRYRASTGLTSKTAAQKVALKTYEDMISRKHGVHVEMTIGEAVDDFLEFSRNHKLSHETDIRRTRTILKYFTKEKFLSEIKKKDIEAFLTWLRNDWKKKSGKELTDATCKGYLAILSVIYNKAIDNEDYDGRNPVKGLAAKLRLRTNSLENYYTEEQLHNILKEAKNISDNGTTRPQKDFYVFLLLVGIGIRPIEIFNMHLNHIFPDRIICPKRRASKTRKDRTVYITPAIYEALKNHDTSGSLLLMTSKTRSSNAFYKLWRILKKRVGVSGRMYDIRHTFATLVYKKTKDLLLTRELMAHANMATTQRYAHLVKDRIDETSRTLQKEILPLDNILMLEPTVEKKKA